MPSDLTTAMRDEGIELPVTYVLTRERVRPTNRWRADPEWRIARQLDVPFATDVDVAATVRIDRRAPDTVLAELLGITGPTASARLAGVPAAGGWAAADGDHDTAWITPFGEAVGAALHAELVDPESPLTLRQRPGDYSVVTAVRLTQGDQAIDVLVGDPDDGGVSSIAVPDGFNAGPLTIEIESIAERTTRDRRYGETVVLPAAISEVGNIVASSMPSEFDTGCREDLVAVGEEFVPVRVAGSVAAAFDGSALETTTCVDTVTLESGTVAVTGQQDRRSGLQVDRLVLGGADARADAARSSDGPTATVVESDRLDRTITVENCSEGCWLIVGEGHHPSWQAASTAGSLGPSQLIAGGFNGWWIPPQDDDADRVGWVDGPAAAQRGDRRQPRRRLRGRSPGDHRSRPPASGPAPRPFRWLGGPAHRRIAAERRRRHRLGRARRTVRRCAVGVVGTRRRRGRGRDRGVSDSRGWSPSPPSCASPSTSSSRLATTIPRRTPASRCGSRTSTISACSPPWPSP